MSGLNISANNNVVVNSRQVRENRTCPSVPAQNSYPNLAPLDKDTVNFKGQATTQKKKGMSTFGKICLGLLGVGAVAYAGVVTHRIKTKPTIDKVAQNFSEIFRKDVSKEEAQKMVDKYKEIFEIKDKDKFIEKCFKQVKSDYGYENIDISIDKLSKEAIEEAKKRGKELSGGFNPLSVTFKDYHGAKYDGTEMILGTKAVVVDPSKSKQEIFKSIVHELRHAKQHEMCYRLDKNKFFDAIKEARMGGCKNESWYNDICNEYISKLNEVYAKTWDKLPQLEKGTNEYNLALKYIEELRNYTGGAENFEKYKEQLIEQEAHVTAPFVQEIYNFFTNPWKIFK